MTPKLPVSRKRTDFVNVAVNEQEKAVITKASKSQCQAECSWSRSALLLEAERDAIPRNMVEIAS